MWSRLLGLVASTGCSAWAWTCRRVCDRSSSPTHSRVCSPRRASIPTTHRPGTSPTSARIEELLHDPRVVAVGECGLDFFRMHSPVEDQLRCLAPTSPCRRTPASRWWCTCETRGPRSCEPSTRATPNTSLSTASAATPRSRGSAPLAATGSRSRATSRIRRTSTCAQAAASVGLDRLLAETDAPFLAPQKLRGSDNEPANVMLTIAELARVRDEPVGSIVSSTSANARSVSRGCVERRTLVRSQGCSEG